MEVADKIIKGIIGNRYSFKAKNDRDYDGVKDKTDCKPNNPLRQHGLSGVGSLANVGNLPIEYKI